MKKLLIILTCSFLLFPLRAQEKSRKYNASENQILWPTSFDPSKSDFYVYNAIEIMAPPNVVWDILVKSSDWHLWYDGIQNIRFVESERHYLGKDVLVFWNSMGQSLNNTITEFVPYERLAWQFNENKIQGHHAWLIIPTKSGCRVITAESQTGRLAKLQSIFIPRKLMNQHDKWLKSLKVESEKRINPQPMTISIEERLNLVNSLQLSQTSLKESIAHLSDTQFHYKSAANSWSIAECVEHITLAEIHFQEILSKALTTPPNSAGRKRIKIADEEIRSKMVEGRWKAKSPELFLPSQTSPSASIAIDAFDKQRLKNIQYIQDTQDDLRNHFWNHPLTGQIDLYQTLLLMSAHTERHINQIKTIQNHKNFPNPPQ